MGTSHQTLWPRGVCRVAQLIPIDHIFGHGETLLEFYAYGGKAVRDRR